MSAVEREIRRAALNACCRHGDNARIAEGWGVDERVVRNVRAGDAPLTDARIAMLPVRIRAAYEREMSGPVQLGIRGIR